MEICGCRPALNKSGSTSRASRSWQNLSVVPLVRLPSTNDGTSWTAVLQVDSTWREQVIPLASLTIGRGVLLPQGFPGEWNYWVGPAEGRGSAGDRLRLAHLERLQLSVRRNEGRGVEVESVVLGFGP